MRVFFTSLTFIILLAAPQTLRAEETELLLPDGIYRGEVSAGVPHGRGVMMWHSDGGSYNGSWTRGIIEGRGVYTSKSGKVTELFYQLGEMAVDYQSLPDGYISTVCQFGSEIYAGAVQEYVQLSSKIDVENESQTVHVAYRIRENDQLNNGVSVCKYAYNEKRQRLEMTDVQMHSIKHSGKKAQEFGEHLEQALFIPSSLE